MSTVITIAATLTASTAIAATTVNRTPSIGTMATVNMASPDTNAGTTATMAMRTMSTDHHGHAIDGDHGDAGHDGDCPRRASAPRAMTTMAHAEHVSRGHHHDGDHAHSASGSGEIEQKLSHILRDVEEIRQALRSH